MTSLEKIADALSDPMRTKILDLLAEGGAEERCSPALEESTASLCACDLAPALGGMAHSKLAYHLKALREAGLLTEERRGKWVYYGLNAQALKGFAAALRDRWLRPTTEAPRAVSRRRS